MDCELLPASRFTSPLQNLESPHAVKTLNDVISSENLPIVLTLCSMLLHTYYAHFNAGIVRAPLSRAEKVGRDHVIFTDIPRPESVDAS